MITIVLSPWLLKEKVNFSTWLAVIVGFIGMIIVINPNSFSEISGIDRSWIEGIVYGILGALFYSLYQIGTRILAPKESTITSLLFSGAAGLFVTSVLIIINFDP